MAAAAPPEEVPSSRPLRTGFTTAFPRRSSGGGPGDAAEPRSSLPTAEADGAEALRSQRPAAGKTLLQTLQCICAGGVAGCVAKTAVAPLSRVTVLMQVQSMRPHKYDVALTPNNRHLYQSLCKIVREESLRGLFRGNAATLVHRFPYTSITFFTNSTVRQLMDEPGTGWLSSTPEPARGIIAGGVAASAGVLGCYPLDVVRTRMMNQTKQQTYSGVCDALRQIFRDEGFRGLYRGLPLSIFSVVPSVSLSFALFEKFSAVYAAHGDLSPGARTLCASGSAGICSCTVTFPCDLIRRQMQMNGLGGRPQVYAGIGDAVTHVYTMGYRRLVRSGRRLAGLRALGEFFRGIVPELLKVVPHNVLLFSVHGKLVSYESGYGR